MGLLTVPERDDPHRIKEAITILEATIAYNNQYNLGQDVLLIHQEILRLIDFEVEIIVSKLNQLEVQATPFLNFNVYSVGSDTYSLQFHRNFQLDLTQTTSSNTSILVL